MRAATSTHFGRSLGHHRVGDFAFSHWVARGATHGIELHGHELPHFMFIAAGAFRTEARPDEPLTSPVVIFNPAQTYHRDHLLTGGAFFSVTVEVDLDTCEIEPPTAPTCLVSQASVATAARLMRASCGQSDEARLGCESLCYELLGSVDPRTKSERNGPPWLHIACTLLRDNGSSLKDAARQIGVHPIHLTRTFRKFMHCTPGEYVRNHRARRAADMLAHSLRSASEIATDCGYADQGHFIRSFRSVYGLSPKQYRQAVN